MKRRNPFWIYGQAAIFLLAACASAVENTPAPAPLLDPTSAVPQAFAPTSGVAGTDFTQIPQVLPVATSRGPDLEATDPATVNLASGQLQLVEFFRFT